MRAFFVWSFRILLIFLLLTGIAIALAPATLVSMAAQKWAPQVKMSEPSGTIWTGEADNVVVSINDTELALGKLSWSLSALSILSANPSMDVNVQAPEHIAKVRVSATTEQVITIDEMEGSFPLALLEPWVPLLVTGDLAFVVDHIVFNPKELLSIDGALNLQEADWVGGDEKMPLGSYIAQVSLADNKDILVELNDFSATLGIDGYLTINPSGTYHFNSVLQARDGLAPEVAQSVTWLGKKNAEGDIVVNQRGRWN